MDIVDGFLLKKHHEESTQTVFWDHSTHLMKQFCVKIIVSDEMQYLSSFLDTVIHDTVDCSVKFVGRGTCHVVHQQTKRIHLDVSELKVINATNDLISTLQSRCPHSSCCVLNEMFTDLKELQVAWRKQSFLLVANFCSFCFCFSVSRNSGW